MKQKLFCTILAFLFFTNYSNAQFVVKDITFSSNSVSNQGKVSGYGTQAGPYGIWLPDSGNVVTYIAGIAPGDGVGGQARFNTNGDFLCGTSMGSLGAEMARYNRSTNEWTTLGSLGFQADNTVSGGYAISGDGNTVAGLAWSDTTGGLLFAHAIAWNQTEGIIDLGSKFAGRSTRANAVSFDGSVVVGWQDFNGPWKSAVWKKNPAGEYFPNEYILIDTLGSATDEFNQLGECTTVSADGKWIGGNGDYANNNQPWIWSKESGLINLGTLPNLGNGFVAGMAADASIVVGWFDAQFWGDPQTPFIWTPTGGLRELNEYINNEMGLSTDTHQVYSAEAISPDGRYIAGYGVETSAGIYFVYRLSLAAPSGVQQINRTDIAIYPNPANSIITIENPSQATLTISSMDGKVFDLIGKLVQNSSLDNGKILTTINVSTLPNGIYLLSYIADGTTLSSAKVVVQH